MEWYVYLAHFCASLFLTNGIPHFVNGISGKSFQSPFASPPGVGESSPLVNVIWGFINFVIGCILLGVGDFAFGSNLDSLIIGVGVFLTAIGLAWHFGRVRGG